MASAFSKYERDECISNEQANKEMKVSAGSWPLIGTGKSSRRIQLGHWKLSIASPAAFLATANPSLVRSPQQRE